MGERVRTETGLSPRACDVCGTSPLRVIESWRKRRGAALLGLRRRAHRRTYELCPGCGCRYPLEDGERVLH